MKRLLYFLLALFAVTADAQTKYRLDSDDIFNPDFWTVSNSNSLLTGVNANASGTLNWARVSKSGSALSDLATRPFSQLTGIPTTISGYGITDAQPLDTDLTSIAALATTSYGRSLLTKSDSTAVLNTLGADGEVWVGPFMDARTVTTKIAWTRNQRDWTIGNGGASVYTPPSGSARDPEMVYDSANSRWVMVYTWVQGGTDYSNFGIATSPDLITWTHVKDLAVGSNLTIWGPTAHINTTTGELQVFVAASQYASTNPAFLTDMKLYEMHPTASWAVSGSWSTPAALTMPSAPGWNEVRIQDVGPSSPFDIGTFAANASTEVITVVRNHRLCIGDRVRVSTTTTLPGGMAAGTDYFVKTVPSSNTITVSATPMGTTLNITSTGTGTHTITRYQSQRMIINDLGGGTGYKIMMPADGSNLAGTWVQVAALSEASYREGPFFFELPEGGYRFFSSFSGAVPPDVVSYQYNDYDASWANPKGLRPCRRYPETSEIDNGAPVRLTGAAAARFTAQSLNGDMAEQTSSKVAITGGTITGTAITGAPGIATATGYPVRVPGHAAFANGGLIALNGAGADDSIFGLGSGDNVLYLTLPTEGTGFSIYNGAHNNERFLFTDAGALTIDSTLTAGAVAATGNVGGATMSVTSGLTFGSGSPDRIDSANGYVTVGFGGSSMFLVLAGGNTGKMQLGGAGVPADTGEKFQLNGSARLGAAGVAISRIRHGTATLTSGTVTVSDTNVSASTRILVTRNGDGGTIGCSYSITRSAGASFTITAKDSAGATQTGDTSTLAYEEIEP